MVLLARTGALARLRAERPDQPVDPAAGNNRPVELADALAVELLNAAHSIALPFDPAARWIASTPSAVRHGDRPTTGEDDGRSRQRGASCTRLGRGRRSARRAAAV